MSIPSYDSHFKAQLRTYLDKILGCVGTENEQYITDPALGDIEPSVAKAFKLAFGGKNPEHTVTVDYTFPDNTTNFEALYIVNRGGSQNQSDSIGNNVQQYDSWDKGITAEMCEVTEDEQGIYLLTKEPISSVINLSGMTNNLYEQDKDNNKRINLGNASLDLSELIGSKLKLQYAPLLEGNNSTSDGVAKGFTIQDSLTVYMVSSNMDTLRCLDNIMKFIIILMKEVGEGPFTVNLPTIHEEPVSLLDETPKDLPVYGIDLSFGYTATYTVHYDMIKRIKEVSLKESINGL